MPVDVVVAAVGFIVTILTVVGMVLMTPRGVEAAGPPAREPAVTEAASTPTDTPTESVVPVRS